MTDPHARYARLRREAPVWWDRGSGAWLVTRHADVVALLGDERLSARTTPEFFAGLPRDVRRELASLEAFFERWLVLSDGPSHQRLRAALAPAFSPRALAALAAGFDEVAEEALEAAWRAGPPDVVGVYARSFAVRAVAGLLGVRPGEQDRVMGWAGVLLRFMGAGQAGAGAGRWAQAALVELRAYVLEVVRNRGADTAAVLPGTVDLDDDELVAVFAQLLAGGAAPVAHCLRGALCAAGSAGGLVALGPPAALVEEVLRYDAPFPFAPRLAVDEIVLGQAVIEAGDRVLLGLASANRDEDAFDQPDRLMLHRHGPRHVAFGRGDHFCLGAVVARMELTAGLRAAARRWPGPADVPTGPAGTGPARDTSDEVPAVPGLV